MKAVPVAACALFVAGSAVLPAEAATPIANSPYEGNTAQGDNFPVHLRTGATNVQRLTISWRARRCDLAKKGTQGTVRLRNLRVSEAGRISGSRRTVSKLPASGGFSGGRQVARVTVKGRFTTTRRITGTLRANVRVFNASGQQIDHCVTPKAIKWRADFIGVIDPGDYTLPG